MARRRRRSRGGEEELLRFVVFALMLVALAIGGLHGFLDVFALLIKLLFILVVGGGGAFVLFLIIRNLQNQRPLRSEPVNPKPDWTIKSIFDTMPHIDWYQFEKFCGAMLQAEGFEVERKGGANPDGGVDLVVQRNNTRTLIQCKHYRKWKIAEPKVRQLLGSMVDFQATRAAMFYYGEATEPAKALAAKHGIGMVDGFDLAERAIKVLDQETLTLLLQTGIHHCPKCEEIMVLRTGNFKPFWGCSQFPRCRGRMEYYGDS